jgi:hypothetical protein
VVDVTVGEAAAGHRRTLGGADQCRVNDHSTPAFDAEVSNVARGTTV